MSTAELSIEELARALLGIEEEVDRHRIAVAGALLFPSVTLDAPTKIFHTEGDGRVCPICDALDGDEFETDDETAPEVPLHPNCRCWWEHSDVPIAL